MKRLTIHEIKEYILANYFDGDENVDACVDGDEEITVMFNIVKSLKKLAEYEDAEENGTLVKLPRKVGNNLYMIIFNKIFEEKLDKIVISYETEHYIFDEFSIGRDVFFTREDAEAALEKMK